MLDVPVPRATVDATREAARAPVGDREDKKASGKGENQNQGVTENDGEEKRKVKIVKVENVDDGQFNCDIHGTVAELVMNRIKNDDKEGDKETSNGEPQWLGLARKDAAKDVKQELRESECV